MEEGRAAAHPPLPASAELLLKKAVPGAPAGNPELAANVVAAGFQALWWLWVRPSAWRGCLADRHPPLPPNFTLGDLGRAALSDQTTRRLLAGLGLCWCILSLATSALVSMAVGGPAMQVWFAVLYGFILSVAGTAVISSLLSVAGGATGGLAIGTVFSLGAASALRKAGSISAIEYALQRSSPIVAIAGGIPALVMVSAGVGAAISVGIGIAGAMTAEPAGSGKASPLARQIGGVVVGVVLSGCIDALVLQALFLTESVANLAVLRATFGMLVAFLVFCAAAVQRRGLKRMAGLASGFGAFAFATVFLASRGPRDSGMSLLLAGVCTALLYSSLFSVAFSAGIRIANSWAGAVASALGSGIPFVLFLSFGTGTTSNWSPVPLSFACICLGLLLPRYGYIPAYPLEMAWNLMVYRADQRRGEGTMLLRNAAFWDDRQRFPFPGLDDHLLLALERSPDIARRALACLGQGPQAWAVGAVRIELCARMLGQCSTLESIGAAHRALPTIGDTNPSDPVQYFRDISRDVYAASQFESPYQRHALLRAIHGRMNDLLLQGLPGACGERLLPVLSRWNQVAAETAGALNELARERGEIENPYVIGVPLTPEQQVFVGRSEISARIAQALLRPHAPPLLLYGQRRMGKTSLLNNLGQLLPGRIVPFFVDLQGPASFAGDFAGFLAALGRAMVDSAMRFRGIRLPPLPFEALGGDPVTVFGRWLDSIQAALEDRVLLLALDEFEALDLSLREHRLDEAALLGLLRHVIQHRRRFRIVLAASHSVEELGRIAGYLINLQMVEIGYLRDSEARQLVEHPLRGFALHYNADAVERVIGLTRGHPHLLQSLCYEIVGLKNEQSRERRYQTSVSDVEEAADQVLKRGRLFFLDIARNQLSPEAHLLAKRIARGYAGAVAEGEALYQLLRRDVVEPAGAVYRFQVELIRRWFAGANPY
jgi:hypothetical protein